MKLNLDKSNWENVRFGDVVQKVTNRIDPTKYDSDVVIKGGHINKRDFHIREYENIKELGYLGPAFHMGFKKHQILYVSRNPHLMKVGYPHFDGICANTTYIMETINHDILRNDLIPFIMHSDTFIEQSVTNVRGGVNPYVNWSDLASIEFLLPPKEEQAKLVELLEAMDEVVETNIQLFSKTQSLYLSIIEKVLINKKSKRTLFSSLGNVVRGVGYKPNELIDIYDENSCILLRSNNISNEKINYKDVKILSAKKVKKVQFLQDYDYAICMSNGSKDLVGKSARYIDNLKKVTIGSFCACFRPKNKYSSDILRHLFASKSYKLSIKGVLSGSAINNLKPSDIEGLFLRINFEMDDFDYVIKKLDYLSDNKLQIENSIKVSRQLFKNLINKIF
jgi:type I restriction enzyme, S subunit